MTLLGSNQSYKGGGNKAKVGRVVYVILGGRTHRRGSTGGGPLYALVLQKKVKSGRECENVR